MAIRPTTLTPPGARRRYANSNEDVSMGRWVHYVEENHAPVEHIVGRFGHSIGLRSAVIALVVWPALSIYRFC